jgi:3-oxoacyl-[acyl-carrier protein] reductase
MLRMKKLEERVAIVTGSGRGIGRAIAQKLASEGARLVVNDLDEAPANETAKLVRDTGAEALVVAGDVAAPDFGGRLVAQTLERFGAIDVVVNNAGYIWNTTIQKHTDEQWAAMLDVHAAAPFRILRAFSEYLREVTKTEASSGAVRCRKVVNVSSLAGVTGAATMLAYSAGKAAVIGMTKTLAKEWGRYNVTVNCVAFGDIDTRLTQPISGDPPTIEVQGRALKVGIDEGMLGVMRMLTPLGRRGRVEDAAGAVYLFCIPESDFISGEVVVCGGGLRI